MKPMNYLDPVIGPDGNVKSLSEFSGDGSGGGGGAVDITSTLIPVQSGVEVISATKIGGGNGFVYAIKLHVASTVTASKLLTGLIGDGIGIIAGWADGSGFSTMKEVRIRNGELETTSTMNSAYTYCIMAETNI